MDTESGSENDFQLIDGIKGGYNLNSVLHVAYMRTEMNFSDQYT